MEELVELERLCDKIGRPPLDGINCVLDRAETGDHDGNDARVLITRRLDHTGAVDAWQPEVGDDDVESELFEQFQGSLAAIGLDDLETTLARRSAIRPRRVVSSSTMSR